MTVEELAEAIPPAYTEFIGNQLMRALLTPQPISSSAETPTFPAKSTK
ncbi:MAG: hypothetical protein LLG01_00720 [Planctomycetaceae bacterium]|nr:hypothetical protein [Planctomycetaceae bacterium]